MLLTYASRGDCTGAICGVIFGPFEAVESAGVMMLFGGLNGDADSIINQEKDESGFSLGRTLFDGTIGDLTVGALYGAGKSFQKASPFVKNAFSKISSKISENTRIAKIALKNMDMPKDVKLACGLGGGNSFLM
ncbi:hypothetical protein KPL47_15800 [Clostridium estertheticum]|uniref:hypothetical protein n=1 Tax=Clostridium estertheticum TaxID=238834 RepID=UPI001C0E586A|nr:hypothetical protein [Clostridium estertheticum]MBU3177795.1 hypothetical protein [Clostridium estertheticum]